MLGTHLEAMVELSEIEEDKSAAREMSLKSNIILKIDLGGNLGMMISRVIAESELRNSIYH
jgi:hypothetical protein